MPKSSKKKKDKAADFSVSIPFEVSSGPWSLNLSAESEVEIRKGQAGRK